MSRLSQETIAVIGVGVALAVLFVTVTNDIRAEARADRAAFQAENARLREEAEISYSTSACPRFPLLPVWA